MYYRIAGLVAAAAALALATGCSATGAAMTGARIGMNLSKTNYYVRVWLDGTEAVENAAEKAMSGYSQLKIAEPVSDQPKLRYELTDPQRFGRITMVAVSLHQEYEGDFSDQAEFTVIAKDANNPMAQMKPGEEYDLGAPGENFKVLDLTNKEVSGVKLKPGLKYSLQLTVKADKSETAAVQFEAK